MTKRPTMVDIALAVGVSQATVSLVLAGGSTTRISAETREKVRTTAAGMGYEKRGLPRGAGTGVVALLLDEVNTTPFAAPFLDAAKEEAAALGWLVATFVTGGDAATETMILQTLTSLDLKGVLYTRLITKTVHPPEALFSLSTVLLNCHEPSRRLPSVVPGDIAGMQAGTEALIRAGHRRIGHIPGEHWTEAARDRLRGYKQALAAHDIPFDPALVSQSAWTVGSGRDAMAALLEAARPTAVTCFNDRVAIGAYEAIHASGLSIPDDMSVIGFDNEDLVAHLTPPLSTLQLPHDEMARVALALLADGRPLAYQRIKVDSPLVLRGSVAAKCI